ncbi:MAG: hypothetical protein HUU35_06750, partial [Armatimonadetes bacterium]|nr:hypothetical protein [Armatimonadota bacterium]
EYRPNPADPLSKYIKITSIGRPGGQATAAHELVAYKPIGIQDYLLFVHDAARAGGTLTLGVPAADLNGDGQTSASGRDVHDNADGSWAASGANDFIPLLLDGPVRSNLDLQILAPARLEPVQSANGWKEKVEVAGSLEQVVDRIARPGGVATGNAEVLVENADLTLGVYEADNAPAVERSQATTPVAGNPWPSQLEVGAGRRIEAPALETYEPVTGISRWDRLTRYSGNDVSVTIGGQTFRLNSGELGYGQGVYVDNEEQRDLFESAPGSWQRPESWGGRRYVPNGCIIELFAHYPDELDPTDPPAIAITRTDGTTWLNPAGGSPGSSTGRRTLVFDWPDKNPTTGWGFSGTVGPRPENGIIVCEGNVRVFGRLPASVVDPAPDNQRDYNLTIVSRGTIYVDGSILRPSDYSNLAESDPENTRLALLARDNVVLNPTTLAPGAVPGMPAAPFTVPSGAPADSHFVLDPSGAQTVGLRTEFIRYSGNRHISVIQADGNPGDGVPARSAVVFNKVRATLGLPAGTTNPATTTTPQLVSASSGLPGIPGRQGVAEPTFLADWRNLARALYPAGGGQTREYRPDTWGLSFDNWNYDPANEQLGVASYITVQGGVDPTASGVYGSQESRSDVIVKNLKVERLSNSGDTNQPRPGFDLVVSALLFAERGGFYVVPGDWFDPRATTQAAMVDSGSSTTITDAEAAAARLARFRRYNYRVVVNGAIAVNRWPSLMEVGEWSDKWAYPPDRVRWSADPSADSAAAGSALFNDYDSIEYHYDWGLRSLAGRPNLPRLPALPASPGLVYVGEEHKQ